MPSISHLLCSRLQTALSVVLLYVCLFFGASGASAQVLAYGTTYTSSAANIATKSGSYIAFSAPAGGAAGQVFNTTMPAGATYDKAQIWLTGFRAYYSQSLAPLKIYKVKVAVSIVSWNSSTGALSWRLDGELGDAAGAATPWKMDFLFQIMTYAGTAMSGVESAAPTCSAAASCTSMHAITGAQPVGMNIAGIALKSFNLSLMAPGAGIDIREMGVNVSTFSLVGTTATVTLNGVLKDDSPTEFMRADATVVAIAGTSSNTAMVVSGDNVFNTNTAFASAGATNSPGGIAITGAYGGLRKWNVAWSAGNARPIWRVDGGYANIAANIPAKQWLATWIGFLGDSWGSTTSTTTFSSTARTVVGFLR